MNGLWRVTNYTECLFHGHYNKENGTDHHLAQCHFCKQKERHMPNSFIRKHCPQIDHMIFCPIPIALIFNILLGNNSYLKCLNMTLQYWIIEPLNFCSYHTEVFRFLCLLLKRSCNFHLRRQNFSELFINRTSKLIMEIWIQTKT